MKHVTHHVVAEQTAPLPRSEFFETVRNPDHRNAEYDRAAAQQAPCLCIYEIDAHWGTDGYALLKPRATQPLASILPPPVVFTGSQAVKVRSQIDATHWERIDVAREALTSGIIAGISTTLVGTLSFYVRFHLVAAALRYNGFDDTAGSTPDPKMSLTRKFMSRLVNDPKVAITIAAAMGYYIGCQVYDNVKERLEAARDDDYSLRDVLDIKDALDTRVAQDSGAGWSQWRDQQLAALRPKVLCAYRQPAAAQAARELIARIESTTL
jgi:hypothetical protein